jgi:hypothetical protein
VHELAVEVERAAADAIGVHAKLLTKATAGKLSAGAGCSRFSRSQTERVTT